MILPTPAAPFQLVPTQGESITIETNAKILVIPTGNQNVLPSYNEYTLNPSRCTLSETPSGGLKHSTIQDNFPGSISINGDGCYLQNLAGTYTGKTIGAGKLSETSSITNTGTTGIEFATADGIIFRPGDGIPFLLSPPSAIVETFNVVNISTNTIPSTITIQCPDSIDHIDLFNISNGLKELIVPTQIATNEYSFIRTLTPNSSESLQLTVVYNSLDSSQTFSNDANVTIGLDNMSESWIALMDFPQTDIIPDASANNNIGTMSHVTIAYDNVGNPYGAVAINGADSSINCGNSSVFNVTTAMTIACWIKVLSYPTIYPRIMSKELTNTGDSFGIYLRSANNNLGVVFNGVTDVATSAANSINSGWNRVVFTFNKPTAQFYINGVSSGNEGTYNFNIAATTYDLLIGNNSAKTRYSNMLIKDVRFYNRAWTQAEITADAAGQSVSTTGLLGQWNPYQPSNQIDFFHFTEQPKSLSYAQDPDGTISEIALNSGNGAVYHGRVVHPDHTRVTGSGYIPDCLNKNIDGSITKFLQAHGMITDYTTDATITTWVVPAISDEKILPLSIISTTYLGNAISIRASLGERTCASFVIRSNKRIPQLTVSCSNLLCGNYTLASSAIDIKSVKCWWRGNYDSSYDYKVYGRYLVPEVLLHDDSLLNVDYDTWIYLNISNDYGKNYLKLTDGSYVDISSATPQRGSPYIVPISTRPVRDADTLQPLDLLPDYNKQFFLTVQIPTNTTPGTYTGTISLSAYGKTLKTLAITLQVLPMTLPASPIKHSLYYRGTIRNNGSISSEDKTAEQYTTEMQDMLVHGVNIPTIYPFDTDENLLAELAIRQQAGIDNTNMYYVGSIDVSQIAHYKTITAPYGVSEIYQYGPDEKSVDPAVIVNIHNAGGKYFVAEYTYEYANPLANLLDLLVAGRLWADVAANYHTYGNKVFSYNNPHASLNYPTTHRKNYGLVLWQNGYDGAMVYTYMHSEGDVWNDFDTWVRDFTYVYPTMNGVVDTLKWEGFSEGLNDLRYIAALDNAIADAKTRGKDTTSYETWEASLKSSDLTNVDLGIVRGQIIDYILQLQAL